ncbi:DNA mismatch repair protein Msh6 [Schistosoma japonicum]|nr:DNA mismatch repair protein Msh6 [Schistosoma japonicum]
MQTQLVKFNFVFLSRKNRPCAYALYLVTVTNGVGTWSIVLLLYIRLQNPIIYKMQKSLLTFFSRSPKPLSESSNNVCSDALQIRNSSPVCLKSPDIVPSLDTSSVSKRRRVIIESSDDDENEASVLLEDKAEVEDKRDLSSYLYSPHHIKKSGKSRVDATDESLSEIDGTARINESFCEEESVSWTHLSLSFLEPAKIKDINGRRPDHPEYDPHTLYVPEEFKNKQTPGMRQWWELKSQYTDVILFFKVGKFYEMYHMDAMIGVKELNLVFMKGNFAHCGFPEVAFPRMADQLVRKGYKVARIEQTESIDAMTERCKRKSSGDKVVRREVCQLITPGTCTASTRSEISDAKSLVINDTETEDESVRDLINSACPDSYLLALVESQGDESHLFFFGIGLLNASTGKISIGQFSDDRHCSRLRTFLSHHPPNQLLIERGATGSALKSLMKTSLSCIPTEFLTPTKQFWSAKKTIEELETADYFQRRMSNFDVSHNSSHVSQVCFPEKENWPNVLLNMLSEDDPLGRTVKSEWELAFCCLGALVYYLRYCLIDREVLSLGFIDVYVPIDMKNTDSHRSTESSELFYNTQSQMVLDNITLSNLDIVRNNVDGSQEGSLLQRLNTCCTFFGRRLLRQWITAPPCNPNVIRQRQLAIENLISFSDMTLKLREKLCQLPDLERLITKIHLLGSKGDKNHPDSRAIIFEEVQYSRKNITDFVATLDGFELSFKIIREIDHFVLSSAHLKNLVTLTSQGGIFPDVSEKINYFKNAFDAEKAKNEGRITPEPGIDPEYDASVSEIKKIIEEMDKFLMKWSKHFGTRLVYWGTGRNRYQIEVPESLALRVPNSWQLSSQRKGVKRYTCSETQEWLSELTAAEERKDASLRSIMQHIFSSFSESFAQWYMAMSCLAELDCLIALSLYSANASDMMCLPEFVDLNSSTKPLLEIVDGIHPCLINTFSGGDIIPNDIKLGATSQVKHLTLRDMFNNASVILVTGPNMGGKSTLMRQAALLVILAHLGCRIPAKSCKLTPVDRIFSRLGASDKMLSGESTFLVELSETASILHHVTPHSLVLMDELGRGTSTHDGSSLAGAVLSYLARPNDRFRNCSGPRTLFSTHYHSLVDQFANIDQTSFNEDMDHSCIGLGHMACIVEEQLESDGDLENITFLYKFIPGACPKSYGFNAARLALLPDKVTRLGLTKAKEFEKTTATFACLRTLLQGPVTVEDLQRWNSKLRTFL